MFFVFCFSCANIHLATSSEIYMYINNFEIMTKLQLASYLSLNACGGVPSITLVSRMKMRGGGGALTIFVLGDRGDIIE